MVGSSHGPRLGRGLGPQPHGESEKARLGTLCPHSKDPWVTSQDARFRWLCCELLLLTFT